MGKDAITAGPAARDDTNRRRGTAALFAALWPSLLGPEHGGDWRALNRRIWRRRLTHVALIAAITGVGALAADPPFHHPGESDAPHDPDGRGEHAHHGPAGAAFDDHQGVQRLLITFRDLHDRGGAAGASPTTTPDTVGDHVEDAAQGPDDRGLRQPWGSGSYGPTLAHYAGGFSGGGGAGGGGGGGGGGSHGGSSSGPSQGHGASPGDPDAPGQQTVPGSSGGPNTSDDPPYIVDPDNGPHQPGDPDPRLPTDWRPPTDAPQAPLSPVPEPQTWLMMIAGFAAIGAALRTRKRRPRLQA